MSYKVVSGFWITESNAKKQLKKIPTIFSRPHIQPVKDGTFAVVAGIYDRKDWADAAVHKLIEAGLYGGIWLES